MAENNLFKLAGQTYQKNFKPKFHNLSTKIDNSKTFTELDAKLTENRLEQMDMFLDTIASDFQPYYRGTKKPPYGEGIRIIQTYGALPVVHYEVPDADSTVCLKIPNNINERAEVMKSFLQLDCSGRKPDALWGENLFLDPSEFKTFQDMKVGSILGSINLHYYLLQQYILSIDPWGEKSDNSENLSDYLQSYGVASLLGAKYDDTTDKFLTQIKKSLDSTSFKAEVMKERKISNKYAYHVNEWLGEKLSDEEKQAIKVYNSPTSDITEAQLKKLYATNENVDPITNLSAAATAIANRAMEMLEPSAKNNSQFCGNVKLEDLKTWGQTKDKFWYLCRARREDLIIVMNSALLRAFKLTRDQASKSTDKGAQAKAIDRLLEFNITGIDNIPYGCIKIHDKHRYNWWTIQEWSGEDTLDQRRVAVWNYHKDILFGIREYPAACVMRIFGLFMYKSTIEALGQLTSAENL